MRTMPFADRDRLTTHSSHTLRAEAAIVRRLYRRLVEQDGAGEVAVCAACLGRELRRPRAATRPDHADIASALHAAPEQHNLP
jgi:hypothetical protein